ncbi:MAG: DUF3300 domain-containing protein [Pseudomonadota bacterium]
MRATSRIIAVVLAVFVAMPVPMRLAAQESAAQDGAAEAPATAEALLTEEELQTLVGPIALYPDTLLIQILVSATVPFDVLKADRFLLENADADAAALADEITAEAWDESVEVLATAFPEIIGQMAEHIEWTEALGTAMLAQQDDVMQAVQDLRAIADENGALASNEAVEVTQDAQDNIIVVPSDPEVVYVPQYEPQQVYTTSGSDSVGDAVATGLIIWGTFVVMDAIFDGSNSYWGCRNCAGWGGGGIYNDIDVDIDIDGDVIIGDRPGQEWRPRPEQRDEARDRIAERRGPDGATTLPVARPSQSDDLRRRLSEQTGAPDIADRANRETLQQIDRDALSGGGQAGTGAEALRERSQQGQALARPDRAAQPAARPAEKPALPTVRPERSAQPGGAVQGAGAQGAGARPAANPAASRPAQSRPNASRAPAAKKAGGAKARAHSARGGASRGGGRPHRR